MIVSTYHLWFLDICGSLKWVTTNCLVCPKSNSQYENAEPFNLLLIWLVCELRLLFLTSSNHCLWYWLDVLTSNHHYNLVSMKGVLWALVFRMRNCKNEQELAIGKEYVLSECSLVDVLRRGSGIEFLTLIMQGSTWLKYYISVWDWGPESAEGVLSFY